MVTAPSLSVIVPAYNEENRLLPTLLEAVRFLDEEGGSYEIIVVDDGSTDKTVEMVEGLGAPSVRVKRLPQNRGKGYAVKAGVLESQGQLVLFIDADGSTPFNQLSLLKKALVPGIGIAFGSRALPSDTAKIDAKFHRKLLGRVFNLLVNLLAIPGVKDTQCGFKLFTREAADLLFPQQTIDGFAFDVELLLLALRSGVKFREVPVSWRNVPGSKVSLVTDSMKMLGHLLRLRFRFIFYGSKSPLP